MISQKLKMKKIHQKQRLNEKFNQTEVEKGTRNKNQDVKSTRFHKKSEKKDQKMIKEESIAEEKRLQTVEDRNKLSLFGKSS